MVAIQPLVSEFNFVGRLEDLLVDTKGRVKYLYLSTLEADYSIEVAKEPKNILSEHLKPGCFLKVLGMRKCKPHKEEVKYKAYRIELLSEKSFPKKPNITTANSTAKVLVCQGSSCCQKGGRAICASLQSQLQAKGLTEDVKIVTTGCLKQCKQAPIVIMPGRNKYIKVQPQELSSLIKEHFGAL